MDDRGMDRVPSVERQHLGDYPAMSIAATLTFLKQYLRLIHAIAEEKQTREKVPVGAIQVGWWAKEQKY